MKSCNPHGREGSGEERFNWLPRPLTPFDLSKVHPFLGAQWVERTPSGGGGLSQLPALTWSPRGRLRSADGVAGRDGLATLPAPQGEPSRADVSPPSRPQPSAAERLCGDAGVCTRRPCRVTVCLACQQTERRAPDSAAAVRVRELQQLPEPSVGHAGAVTYRK